MNIDFDFFTLDNGLRVILHLDVNSNVVTTNILYNVGSKDSLSKLPTGIEMMPLDNSEPIELLKALAEKGCNRVLWECGPNLATLALKQGCVQELAIFLKIRSNKF